MKSKKLKSWQRDTLLFGAILSFCLLIFLALMQRNQAPELSLEVKWIFVSGVPLFLAFVISNVIRSIEWNGFKLGLNLDEPVSSANLLSPIDSDLQFREGFLKEGTGKLSRLSNSERLMITRLAFDVTRAQYYDAVAVAEYLDVLTGVYFFELVERGKFVGLLLASNFRDPRTLHIHLENISEFIRELQSDSWRDAYPVSLITSSVAPDTTLRDALKKMISENLDFLPVVKSHRLIGVLEGRASFRNVTSRIL